MWVPLHEEKHEKIAAAEFDRDLCVLDVRHHSSDAPISQ